MCHSLIEVQYILKCMIEASKRDDNSINAGTIKSLFPLCEFLLSPESFGKIEDNDDENEDDDETDKLIEQITTSTVIVVAIVVASISEMQY